MIRFVDAFLDHITMYRLTLYYLVGLVGLAVVLALFGIVPHTPVAIVTSLIVILAASWAANWLFARILRIPPNVESVYITALILVLILEPASLTDLAGVAALAFASVWAIATKFLLTVSRKHVFNPAAAGAVLSALVLDHPATWWVGGNTALLPAVLIGGLLLVRKLRRFDLVGAFVAVALATTLVTSASPLMALNQTLFSSPLLFLAFVMLTEPLTSPTMPVPRLVFAAIVGVLFAPDVHFGSFYLTPEMALLAGNLFALATGPRGRMLLTLERIEQQAADTYDFIFRPQRRLAFEPGQYLEWTLPLDESDSRGNRRYFTIASAPTEDKLRVGVKFYAKPSAFKRALDAMRPGDRIFASQLAGSFTLPRNPDAKLAFIAGGIGITPFRSMLEDLIAHGEPRPVILLYGVETEADIAYRPTLDAARQQLGIRTVFAVRNGAVKGQYPGLVDARLIKHAIPDFRERTFYVSGPQAMVANVRAMLLRMGVHRSRIRVDFFPGFA